MFAAMMMAEVGCWYKSKGLSVYDGLLALYERYGYFIENTESTVFKGFDSNERREAVMSRIRQEPPESIGLRVEGLTDYTKDVPGFTKSNVLFYSLADGCAVAIRPSGTEPKIKFYYGIVGTSLEDAGRMDEEFKKKIDKMVEEMV